ncbi:DinB family protein [Spelaeicoccus albus]|uniref:Putative damage-inducible protein DinB n=1 Tax=Spelaeicoccus albus TaxID=1280376 RepID=A0A7Z0D382_9MICO|nr:DinB family protein [Spelaeicoccus albus]NYI68052.1 putative damage-inducible protein DinB [Spelaeicoccus albus]
MHTPKEVFRMYLQSHREALIWKLDGLGERDMRRPVTPTGTNLLGLVKHVASTEAGYLGDVFGSPFPEPLPWMEESAEDNADMWATADEPAEAVIGLYRRVWTHSDATIDRLGLTAEGSVPWWPAERRTVTLQQILVHVIAETARHAGHADIVRESIDGQIGLRHGNENLPPLDAGKWREYRAKLEATANLFA